jgi:hypothetical protein
VQLYGVHRGVAGTVDVAIARAHMGSLQVELMAEASRCIDPASDVGIVGTRPGGR